MRDGGVVDQGPPAELTRRVAGEWVIEVGGIAAERMTQIVEQTGCWMRPIASHLLVGGDGVEKALHLIEAERPPFLSRRPADLQDVFLLTTGVGLQ